MVLQRDRDVAVWGKATPDADVQVSFKGQSRSDKADSAGNWRVTIPTGKADAAGNEMTIVSAGTKITLSDVLVGEVWFASGQSNMVFTMNRVPAYAEVIKERAFPKSACSTRRR